MPSYTAAEIEFMKLALSVARESSNEDDRANPFVGVVVTRDDQVITTAHRGMKGPGTHAEYSALSTLAGEDLSETVVYVTLEPCTKRGQKKIPCAERLAHAGVRRVFIGMLDPNPDISGRGQQMLADRDIETILFDPAIAAQVRDLNRAFIARFRPQLRVLTGRDDVQEQLGRVFDAVANKPKRVSQTLVNAFPIARSSDFLLRVNPNDCDVTRAIVISDSADLAFAHHSIELAPQFKRFKTKLAYAPQLGATLPSITNVTAVDDHVLLTCPFWSGELLPAWRYFQPSSGAAVFSDTTGLYVQDRASADVFAAFVDRLGGQFDTLRSSRAASDRAFLDWIKGDLLDLDANANPSTEGLARYLYGFAIALRAEIRYAPSLASKVLFLGIVGSLARALLDIARGKGSSERPGDLDLLVVLEELTPDAYAELVNAIEQLCETYSLDGALSLRAEFHTSPAKPGDTTNWFPVQVVIQTREWLQNNGVPYIYAHRKKNHVALFGKFPEMEHLNSFTPLHVLDLEDGIRYCLNDLKTGVSRGFVWDVDNETNTMTRTEHPIEMDDKTRLSFACYALQWTLYNLAHTNPGVSRLRGVTDTAEALKRLTTDALTEPERDLLMRLLAKQWKTANNAALREWVDAETWQVAVKALEAIAGFINTGRGRKA